MGIGCIASMGWRLWKFSKLPLLPFAPLLRLTMTAALSSWYVLGSEASIGIGECIARSLPFRNFWEDL